MKPSWNFWANLKEKLFLGHIDGHLDAEGTLEISFHAVTEHEILNEFERFWRPFWLRDERVEQFQDGTWSDFCNRSESSQLPKLPAITLELDDPQV